MEHTPGPWHVNGVDAILSVKGNRSVAKVYHPEADACLIAAAPELLKALEEAADLLRTEVRKHHDNLEPVQELRVLKVLNRARAAIEAAIEVAE